MERREFTNLVGVFSRVFPRAVAMVTKEGKDKVFVEYYGDTYVIESAPEKPYKELAYRVFSKD